MTADPATAPDAPEAAASSGALRVPWIGAAVAAGLLVTEAAATVRPLMDGFGAGGAWRPMAEVLVAYLAVGCCVDLAVQPLAAKRRHPRLIRSVAVLGLGAVIALVSGQVPGAVLAAFGGAALWALAASSRWTAIVAVAVALWALLPALPRSVHVAEADVQATSAAGPASDAPSLVVVVLDTVRRDRTSTWGNPRTTTPNLSAVAARGARFDAAYSPSCWSLPAHASLFTGLLPSGHGAHYEHLALPPEVPVLAELLAARGYRTAGFSANPLVAPGTGMARGFEHFEEPWRTYTLREALLGWRIWNRFAAPDRDKGGAEVVAAARAWLEGRDAARPYLVFVNLMEAHAPYQEAPLRWRRAWTSPELSRARLEAIGERSHMAQALGSDMAEADRETTLALLDGATAAADDYLGQLLSAVGDDAIVVVTSDHGELLGEHGLWGHSLGLWQPLIEVPLAIAGPGVPAGIRIDAPVSLMDLFPTLLGLGGVEAPTSDGVDLRPLLGGVPFGEPRTIRAEHLRTDFLTSGWQLTRPLEDRAPIRARRSAALRGALKREVSEDGGDWGFDLSADPDELAPFPGGETGLDVVLPEPDRAPGTVGPDGPPPLDPAQEEALRALGYIR
jgi:arylsulfatase A-like enzyme